MRIYPKSKTKIITPEKYMELLEKGEKIKLVEFIPPRIGKDKHFGRVKIELEKDRYNYRFDDFSL